MSAKGLMYEAFLRFKYFVRNCNLLKIVHRESFLAMLHTMTLLYTIMCKYNFNLTKCYAL